MFATAGVAARTAPARLLGFLLLATLAAPTFGESIALIKSYDFAPYDAAISGFLSSCNNEITEYNLRGEAGGSSDLIRDIILGRPDLVVAIGVLAAEFAR